MVGLVSYRDAKFGWWNSHIYDLLTVTIIENLKFIIECQNAGYAANGVYT